MTRVLIDSRIHSHAEVLRVPRGRARLEAVGAWILGVTEAVADGHPEEAPDAFPADLWRVEDGRSRWDVDPADRAYIYARDGHACLMCGSEDGLTIDHVIPKSRGGEHVRGNFQTLCRPCNSSKGVRTIDLRGGAA